MTSEGVLWRVGVMHAVLLSVLLLALATFGHPLRGTLLGGSLIGLSFATFWMAARSITNPARRGIAILLGVAKVALFLGLSAAVLSGRVVADADGFALGISCFLLATLTVVFRSHVSVVADQEAGF
jgi:hypothetical protein